MSANVDLKTSLKGALLLLALVAVLGVILGVTLPHEFFEGWGWLVGPVAWLGCAAATGAVLRLSIPMTLVGAILSGIPGALATLTGVHWLGVAVGIITFGLWCGWLAARGPAAGKTA